MSIKSAIVDNEAFIQGKYLSVGINRDGSLGTRKAAPDGFHSDTPAGFLRTGLFADLDGFGQGKSNQLSDAVLLGRAIEGFNIGYKIDGNTIVQSNQSLTGYSEVDGVNSKTSTTGQIAWKGVTTEDLAVSQKITLTDDAKFIRIDVTLTNNSSEKMSDVRYMRSADPDQADNFATANKIVRQGDDNGALVASGLGKTGATFFLFSEDSRAVVSTYGFVNTDPYASTAYSNPQDEGYSETADETSNITFGLGTLDQGESETITLYMGVTDDLAETISQIENGDGGGDGGEEPPVDLPPVARNDVLTLKENGSGKGNVLANDRDPEGADLTASLKSGPANGKLNFSSDGSFTYTPDKGFSGVDTFTYTASDGDKTDTATVTLTVEAAPVVDLPPIARNDALTLDENGSGKGNVLANDRDPEGAELTASLNSGPANGKLKLSSDGSFTYTPDKDFSGVDTFTYTASDGDKTDTATVTLTMEAVPDEPEPMPDSPLLNRAGTQNGSPSSNDALRGPAYQNSFFFDVDAASGADRIVNFGSSDLLVVDGPLYDGNGDGLIGLDLGTLSLDGPTGTDTVEIAGVSTLRFLGTDAHGLRVYGDADVRPDGAVEGGLGDDNHSGDILDLQGDVFFYDTALDINLGADRIDHFGSRDVIVTTSALLDRNGDGVINFNSGELRLSGAAGGPGDVAKPGEAGSTSLFGTDGDRILALEFDGSMERDGTTYYVYSLVGSSAGEAGVDFAGIGNVDFYGIADVAF